MVLHPCERCGEADFPWSRHEIGPGEGGLVSVYEGDCPSCGQGRRFAFAVDEEPVPPPAYGGPEPSQIIDPGEFYAMAERAAAYARAVPDGHEAAVDALAAIEEVLKFLPPGADAVPEDAFASAGGMAVYSAGPERFRRERLESLRDEYRRATLAR